MSIRALDFTDGQPRASVVVDCSAGESSEPEVQMLQGMVGWGQPLLHHITWSMNEFLWNAGDLSEETTVGSPSKPVTTQMITNA